MFSQRHERAHVHRDTHVLMNPRTHVRMYACTHVPMHPCTHPHTHKHTHPHMHTCRFAGAGACRASRRIQRHALRPDHRRASLRYVWRHVRRHVCRRAYRYVNRPVKREARVKRAHSALLNIRRMCGHVYRHAYPHAYRLRHGHVFSSVINRRACVHEGVLACVPVCVQWEGAMGLPPGRYKLLIEV